MGGTESRSKTRKEELPEIDLPDGTVIGADGLGYHVLENGKRCWIPDTWTMAMYHLTPQDAVMVFPDQLLALPAGKPVPSLRPKEPLI